MKKKLLIAIAVFSLALSTIASPSVNAQNDNLEDWQITTEVDISKNGEANVTLKVNESVGVVSLIKENVKDLSIDKNSKDCIVLEDRRAKWDTGKSKSISYSVSLGNLRFGSTVQENYILFRTEGLMILHYWDPRGLPRPSRYLKVIPPAGWNAASPGRRVSENKFQLESVYHTHLREIIAVGNFDVLSDSVEGAVFRFVKLPSAQGASSQEVLKFIKGLIPELKKTLNIDPVPPLVIHAPSKSGTDTTTARGRTAVFNVRRPLFSKGPGSICAHELTHTFQYYSGSLNWFQAGSAQYYAFYLPWKSGFISEREFRESLQSYVTTRGKKTIGEPIKASASISPYKKGAAILAALDMDIRARTDGEKTLADVVRLLNPQKEESDEWLRISKEEFLTALKRTTGFRYDDFCTKYIESAKFPREILSENFSLDDPVPVFEAKKS